MPDVGLVGFIGSSASVFIAGSRSSAVVAAVALISFRISILWTFGPVVIVTGDPAWIVKGSLVAIAIALIGFFGIGFFF